MINSFRHKGLKLLFESGERRGVPADMAERIVRRLDAINAATVPTDLNLPGFVLHELKGDRKGTWSLGVSGNYRITFSFREGDAFDVHLEDYQ
jgi:proteic killer suppression protein